MAFSSTLGTVICISLLFSLSLGQQATTKACSDVSTQSGNEYFPDDLYCNVFGRCLNERITRLACSEGTCWSVATNSCVHIWDTVNPGCPCETAAHEGRGYRLSCLDQYVVCTQGTLVKRNCSAGQVYQVSTQSCVAVTTEVDDPLCYRPTGNNVSGQCNNFAHPDPCKYVTRTSNVTNETMSCGEGTSFQESTCGCNIRSDGCFRNDTYTFNKRPDPQCRPSFYCRFDEVGSEAGLARAYSYKLGTSSTPLNSIVKINNGQLSPGGLQLAGDGYAYSYLYDSNQLTPDIAICIIFRAAQASTGQTTIFSNEFRDYCTSTYKLTFTKSGATYNFMATATGLTPTSMKNRTTATGSVTATIALPNADNFLQACLIFSKTVNIRLADKGAAGDTVGSTTVSVNGTAVLGTTLATNKCGHNIGTGFSGVIRQANINEGCANINNLAY